MKHIFIGNKLLIIITLISALILLNSETLQAQIKSKIALGGTFSRGNVSKQDYRAEGDFTKTDSLLEFSAGLKGAFSANDTITTNQELQGNLRLDYLHNKLFSPFVAISGFNNKFKDISLRFSTMLGMKWQIYKAIDKNDKKNVVSNYSLSAAYQYDVEKYYSPKPQAELSRLSIRLKIRQMLVDNIYLESVTFLKYKVDDFSDYQIESKTDLSTQVTKKLQLQLSYEIDNSSKPPQPADKARVIQPTDHIFYISLVYKIY